MPPAPLETPVQGSPRCRRLPSRSPYSLGREAGPGEGPLAFLVGGSEPLAERSGHLFELLEFWHGALVAQGVMEELLAWEALPGAVLP